MSYTKTAVIVLITAMIFSLVLTYASIMTIIQTTKDNIEQALDSFVIENSTYIFNSIKNGSDITSKIDTEHFIKKYFSNGTLDYDGSYFYNKDEKENIIYKFTTPQTSFTINNTLNLASQFDIFIPVYFAGKQVTQIRIPITVKTSYNLK